MPAPGKGGRVCASGPLRSLPLLFQSARLQLLLELPNQILAYPFLRLDGGSGNMRSEQHVVQLEQGPGIGLGGIDINGRAGQMAGLEGGRT